MGYGTLSPRESSPLRSLSRKPVDKSERYGDYAVGHIGPGMVPTQGSGSDFHEPRYSTPFKGMDSCSHFLDGNATGILHPNASNSSTPRRPPLGSFDVEYGRVLASHLTPRAPTPTSYNIEQDTPSPRVVRSQPVVVNEYSSPLKQLSTRRFTPSAVFARDVTSGMTPLT